MNKLWGVRKTVELVEQLREVAGEFAAREQELNRNHERRLNTERERSAAAHQSIADGLVTSLSEAGAAFQAANDAAEEKFRSRQNRIAAAFKASQRNAEAAIERREGGRKYKLQEQMMQATRGHDEGLANAKKVFAQFQIDQMQAQEELARDEQAALGPLSAYGKFKGYLRGTGPIPEPDLTPDEYQLLEKAGSLRAQSRADLERFRKHLLPVVFRFLPVWLLVLLACAPIAFHFGLGKISLVQAFVGAGVFLVASLLLRYVGYRQTQPIALSIATSLVQARLMLNACPAKSEARRVADMEREENARAAHKESYRSDWGLALEDSARERDSSGSHLNAKRARADNSNTEFHSRRRQLLEKLHHKTLDRLRQESADSQTSFDAAASEREQKINAEHAAAWRTLEADWKRAIEPVSTAIADAQAGAAVEFPDWSRELLAQWTPPAQFTHAAQFGRLEIELAKLCPALPRDPRLSAPELAHFQLPLLLTFPQEGSLLLDSTEGGREAMTASLNNIILRLLSKAPPGRIVFTILDPVGLGQSFAAMMHLADFAEHLINSRIWTQSSQIEQKLADLNEHMEKVIQMYLRNEFATIAEYNEQAGNIAEKYHFLVVAGFPSGFSDTAARRLLSIATSGARCGVHTLIQWDRRQPVPQDFLPNEIRRSSISVGCKRDQFFLGEERPPGVRLLLEEPPPAEWVTEFIQRVGRLSRDSNRVEVPFAQVAPPASEIWAQDNTSELRVPIGRTGATKFQYLALGQGTRQHVVIAGKTGSGKSTLFHVMICNLALWCSPEQVEFYLVDFKKGVEFKCYASARLPHARVVAIESDREFGLSVLQKIDDELRRRGDLFRKMGAQDLAGYKRAGGTESMPRSLLLIDEFQEFFVEDDKISQNASLLLDRLVRQGRAFGIHVILGSQTLGGAYSVARTTLGQMAIRIALQCNLADAYLIMDENNPAPRLLSRPGEGIYNDAAGAVEGNSPFQTVWLPDEVRARYLDQVRQLADERTPSFSGPIVFEGNAPADVRENTLLRGLLTAAAPSKPTAARIWLGAPNSIKGPTEAMFGGQSGNHLLIVGQREEAALTILSLGLISLAAQYSLGAVKFIFCTPPESTHQAYLDRVFAAVRHPVTVVDNSGLAAVMTELAAEMKLRTENPKAAEAPPVFLFVHDLQRFSKLRFEEDYGFSSDAAANPAVQLNQLLCEGASLGFHVIASADAYSTVTRFLSRKSVSEFEMRVVFQMSASDSASLIENPNANMLGLHRALFFNQQRGNLETFRPYALPANDWLDEAAQNLARLLGSG